MVIIMKVNDEEEINVTKFDRYLLEEYEHIAEAHFRVNETVTAFFRYHLLIMSLPISIIAVLIATESNGSSLVGSWEAYVPLIAAVFLIIGVAGFGVLVYLTNLRMDALLYARTVNAIRRHFFDNGPIDIYAKFHKRVLPQTPYQPRYFEPRYFLSVVVTMALFNAFYIFCAAALFGGLPVQDISLHNVPWFAWLAFSLYLFAHLFVYWRASLHRESTYLKPCAIGVDIDGVLNKHRDQFCKILYTNTGKQVKPDDITIIPVDKDPRLGVTLENAENVFNEPEYWFDMEPTEHSSRTLQEIRRTYKLRIFLFTNRPWPCLKNIEVEEKQQTLDKWRQAANGGGNSVKGLMRCITEKWLKEHNFEYDKLIIEEGGSSRLNMAKQGGILFFIEDELEKAKKLARICDIVFLFDQPYNQEGKLPDNIIRVTSWEQLYQELGRFTL
jgi:uncharacterized HAD superfamily protein